MKVRSNLASMRERRGFSVSELAKRVGVNRQTIYAIETGSYLPNTEVALKLALELETTVEDLFQLDTNRQHAPNEVQTEYLSIDRPSAGQAVRTAKIGATWVSVPVSATPYHLPEADGVVASPVRGARGSAVHMLSSPSDASNRLIVAGCDPASGILAAMAESSGGIEVMHAPASSQQALDWLSAGFVHLAGTHLQDSRTGEFNLPFIQRQFPKKQMTIVTFAEWEAGLVLASGNPKHIRGLGDLARKNVSIVNREQGSGSRRLLDRLLHESSLEGDKIRGYDRIESGHLAAAYSVHSRLADCCVATRSAARAFDLDFIPLHLERYDFVMFSETASSPQAQRFLNVLQRADLRRKLETLAGYTTRKTGAEIQQRSE